MTRPADKRGASFSDPVFDFLVAALWKRWLTVSNYADDVAKECSRTATTLPRRGRKLRDLYSILLQMFPPDAKIPDGMKDKEVLNLIEPEYRKQGKTPPSIDTVARARGRRKKYSSKARRPKK